MGKILSIFEKIPQACFEGVFIGAVLGALLLLWHTFRQKKNRTDCWFELSALSGKISFLYFCLVSALLMILWRIGVNASSNRYYIGLFLPFLFLVLIGYQARWITPIPEIWRRWIPAVLIIALIAASTVESLRFHDRSTFFTEMGSQVKTALAGARRPVIVANKAHEERVLYYAGTETFLAMARARKVGNLSDRVAEALLMGDKIAVIADQDSQFERLMSETYPQVKYRRVVTLPFRKDRPATLYLLDNSDNPMWGRPATRSAAQLPSGYRLLRQDDFEVSETLSYADNKRFSGRGGQGTYTFFAQWPFWSTTAADIELRNSSTTNKAISGAGSLCVKSNGMVQLKPFALAPGGRYYCRYLYTGGMDALMSIKMRVPGARDITLFTSLAIDAGSVREAEFYFDTPVSPYQSELIFEFSGGEMLLDNFILGQALDSPAAATMGSHEK